MSRISRDRRKKVTAKGVPSFPPGRSFRIVEPMHMTPLLAMRQAAGLSLKEVAEALGCSYQAVSAFEAGRTEIRAELVKKYARVLGVNDVTMARMRLRSKLSFHRREAQRAEAELKALGAKGSKHSSAA